ncbi:hypothetical protein [Amycolatopsis sp. FDAARGOS 1241]|uniref:hypothetical protein n=1 Tax=Amycolatopsis sp. FDAARGOS 1241 TaxID=2778070 RepID=UPI001950A398|nr:hypothetical protein [Amycolatopsis sp. FDAARGOS 1241]QRP45775.1 hypothetical protein I6J71_42950 [Amycolatopsis sp. FDAARGOS 1241]
MELTGRDFDKIPPRNLHVPVVDFARLWLAAEQRYDAERSWAALGVVDVCRWLACATVRLETGRTFLAYAPVTERTGLAHEETIQAECVAAEVLLFRRPVPAWLAERPGWLESIVLALGWAWQRSGTAPMEVPAHIPG